jgi:hypothetical protein
MTLTNTRIRRNLREINRQTSIALTEEKSTERLPREAESRLATGPRDTDA